MSSANAQRRRAQQLRRTRSRRRGGAENQTPVRLIVCGVIFVLLVAAKLLFPEAVERLAGSARQLIGRDADFREAFAAVGRAVSGERSVGDSLQEAYTAVFNPDPDLEQQHDPAPEDGPVPEARPEEDSRPASNTAAGPSGPDTRILRFGALELPEADKAVMRELLISPESASGSIAHPAGDGGGSQPPEAPESPPEEDDTATAEAFHLYTMAAMPENASLEQRNLGFAHTSPIRGALSSAFGWREHPIEGGNKFHYGVDLAADQGTDILAFADGEVYATGESSTLGNYIMLQHQGGYITLYAHCSRVTVSGGPVAQGEKIAEVGSTGLVTGPHLHFELHDGDLYLNPIYYVEIG